MAKQYRYRAALNIISGGYTGEETGTIPANDPWHTADLPGSGEEEYEYYYRDSGTSQNSNSSRVRIKVKDTWTTTVDNRNIITVNVRSAITSIVRDDIRGTPSGGYASTRNLYIRREVGGTVLRSFLNDNIDTAHTIFSGEIILDQYSFTLEPGTEMNRGTIYFTNVVPGHESDPLPNMYTDVLWIGITFLNPLPADYIPGATYNATTHKWMSHNRTGGAAKLYNGSAWGSDMRTDSGDGQTTGNPPYIRNASNVWVNMRNIGEE